MTCKSILNAFFALCITAILWIALCGCDDLGAYEDTTQYYDSFGDIVLIGGTSKDTDEYSVEEYFYNEESREDFLQGEDGAYKGVKHDDYVYIAIPFESNIDMDTLALYIQSQDDVAVYINVFVTDKIPSEWRPISDNVIGGDSLEEPETEVTADEAESGEESDPESGEGSETESEEKEYDDPDPSTRVAEVVVHLEKEVWNSLLVEKFNVNGNTEESIQIKDGQYVLIQIRNNSGVRVFDVEQQVFVDPETGLELPRAVITVTNLLIRALGVTDENEAQGGE